MRYKMFSFTITQRYFISVVNLYDSSFYYYINQQLIMKITINLINQYSARKCNNTILL